MILLSLENEPRRFNDLKKTVDGISQKVLTENLRTLERDGLVLRKVISSRPIKVEYRTTSLSLELKNNEKYDSHNARESLRQLA